MELSSQNILHREVLQASVVILSIVDNSLLVYTADNNLLHYLIVPTADSIKLHLCGSISFNGIIAAPGAVRMLSWMIPGVQKRACVSQYFVQRMTPRYRNRGSRERLDCCDCSYGGRRAAGFAPPAKGKDYNP